ncbi:MAG: ATP-binding cassette domain-containing protein [Candidatus Margulisiibacteriota bacterium]
MTKTFADKTIIENMTMDIPDGQKLAVIGPSGCGKSTLLRLLICLLKPTSGAVFIDNVDINLLKETDLMKLRRKIGMVFQSSALFDSMNVFENVAFGLRQQEQHPENYIKDKVKEKLKMVDLDGTQDLLPSELSGGMQKRISLARAMATDPKIILYDEPTTGLDPITSTNIEDMINKMNKELHVTSVIVTHQLSTIFRTSDRIVMLNEGRFIETGSVEMTKASSDPVVRNFIKGGLP